MSEKPFVFILNTLLWIALVMQQMKARLKIQAADHGPPPAAL